MVIFGRVFFSQGFSCHQVQEKMLCPWNKEHLLLLFMSFSASECCFFFMILSCQNWFCLYQLLVTPDWILAVDYDFFRIFFNCKSFAKPACIDSCVTAAIFWEVFSVAGWAFLNVDEFPQPGDEQSACCLYMVKGTQSKRHRIKNSMVGALVLLGISTKTFRGVAWFLLQFSMN